MAVAATRLLDFLKTVKFKTELDGYYLHYLRHMKLHNVATITGMIYTVLVSRVTLLEKLSAGEKDVIYSIFEWALPQHKHLSKQAEIGYYLTFPEVRTSSIR